MLPLNASKRPRLTKRDRAILDHVSRFRIATNESIHKLFFPHGQPNAVTKVTARLTKWRMLRQFPLYHPRTYFTLGDEGTALLGLPENRALPLGPQSLPSEYGVLAYATLGQAYHERLSRRELAEQFPYLSQGLCEQPYTIDEQRGMLELVRVDLGGAADHVARKCEQNVKARMMVAEFAALVKESRFRLVIVTCTTEKAAAIRDSLDGRLWPEGLHLHLAIVSDLVFLTASLSHAS